MCLCTQGTADDDDIYSAATALKRIAALSRQVCVVMMNIAVVQTISYTEVCVSVLSSAQDPTGWKLFDSCLKLLKSRIESRELDKEVDDNLSCCFVIIEAIT